MCSYSWYGSVLLFSDMWAFGSIWRVRIWSDLGSILDGLEPLSWILVQLPGLNDSIEAAPTTSEQPDFTHGVCSICQIIPWIMFTVNIPYILGTEENHGSLPPCKDLRLSIHWSILLPTYTTMFVKLTSFMRICVKPHPHPPWDHWCVYEDKFKF